MNRPRLTFVQRIGLELLWLLARAVAVMPYWVKYYVIENLLFVLLFYCLRYRRRVVTENLRGSFPEKSEAELRTIRRRFYRTLAEVVVDTVNMAHMSEAKAREGIGIGLYLARKIIELQKGYIEVKSEVGEGAEFRIYLLNS